MMTDTRLRQQLDFILEMDRLKHVIRQSYLLGPGRRENSAEHSWHTALMAIVLAEHADEGVDPGRAAKMLLLHDIVEIDAGDTYCYDEEGAVSKGERENRAAERIFGLLPDDQAKAFREIWEEFEARRTPDAKFAAALDRLMPVLHNFHTRGKSWREHGISREQVLGRTGHVREISQSLWGLIESIVDDSVSKGYLKD
ncbi:Phosphohydrolase [Candidatus Desulfarcum epimagneticum]|uniref:Phosphohydrolase n=1 Tax=uncultured Desulfobacteraceae bacterium TaxID=218296 RepID=A0A484HLC4_9BACT|nr:Phosphohydrolase [uncultured Desulfobacteraceae bacterium]